MTVTKTYFVLWYILALMLSNCQSFLVPHRKKIDPTAKKDLSNDVVGRSIAIFVKGSDKRDQKKLPEWAREMGNESVYFNPAKYEEYWGHNLSNITCTQVDRDKG